MWKDLIQLIKESFFTFDIPFNESIKQLFRNASKTTFYILPVDSLRKYTSISCQGWVCSCLVVFPVFLLEYIQKTDDWNTPFRYKPWDNATKYYVKNMIILVCMLIFEYLMWISDPLYADLVSTMPGRFPKVHFATFLIYQNASFSIHTNMVFSLWTTEYCARGY